MVLLRKPESCETMTEFRVRLFRIRSGKKRKLTGSASGETGEVALQPSDVDNIQMVSWFVAQQDIGLEKHGTGQCEFHLPTSRKAANALLLANTIETDRFEGADNFSLGGLDSLVGQNPS